jgi:hypothetical protein
MVGRVTTAWILMATLLLCPGACLGEAVAAHRSPDVGRDFGATDTCSCCAPSRSTHSQPAPGDPGPGQKGGNCLCHGAVVADHSSDVDFQPLAGFWVILSLPTARGDALSAFDASAAKHACHFANVDSGREVRALIESFLL